MGLLSFLQPKKRGFEETMEMFSKDKIKVTPKKLAECYFHLCQKSAANFEQILRDSGNPEIFELQPFHMRAVHTVAFHVWASSVAIHSETDVIGDLFNCFLVLFRDEQIPVEYADAIIYLTSSAFDSYAIAYQQMCLGQTMAVADEALRQVLSGGAEIEDRFLLPSLRVKVAMYFEDFIAGVARARQCYEVQRPAPASSPSTLSQHARTPEELRKFKELDKSYNKMMRQFQRYLK